MKNLGDLTKFVEKEVADNVVAAGDLEAFRSYFRSVQEEVITQEDLEGSGVLEAIAQNECLR
jgi:hypothetical protein